MNLPNPSSISRNIITNVFTKIISGFFIAFATLTNAQASFNLTHTLCAGNTVSVVANSGTLSATNYTWSSVSSGPVFSSANASLSDVYFPSAGTYTIDLTLTDGTITSASSQTIVVCPLPVLTLTSSASPICVNDGATLTASGAVSYSWNPTGGLYFLSNLHDAAYVTPPVTTSYTVSGTSNLGCQNSAAFTIIVNPYPNVAISANTTSVCAGFYATLTGLGASGYTWTSSTFSAPVTQATVSAGPGTYTLLGANGNCHDVTGIDIDLLPNLLVNITASRFTICKDDGDSIVPVILNASGATSYTWEPYQPIRMTYSIGPSTSVSPSVSTIYTVTGGNNFCSGKSVISVQVITCTDLEEQQALKPIHVFPNPAHDKLTLHTSFQGEAIIKVINMTGEIIMQEKRNLTGEEQTLSLQDLPTGIYLVSYEAKGQSPYLVRVVKQ